MRIKTPLSLRKRHSNATRIGRIHHSPRGDPQPRPQSVRNPIQGGFQEWAVVAAAVDPSGAVATTGCGVCVAFGLECGV